MPYITTETYPKTATAWRQTISWVKCHYCARDVAMDRLRRLNVHYNFHAWRVCEGSTRFWWHMFGERMKRER